MKIEAYSVGVLFSLWMWSAHYIDSIFLDKLIIKLKTTIFQDKIIDISCNLTSKEA